MKNYLPKLPPPNSGLWVLPWFSPGVFSLFELIEFTMSFYNQPASMFISSFSIGEDAVRTFDRLSQKKLLIKSHLLLDLNIKRHKIGMLFFSLNIAQEIRLAKNHSKIVLLNFGFQQITIVGSANLNLNDKIEAGIISNNPALFNYYKDHLTTVYNDAIKVDINDFI